MPLSIKSNVIKDRLVSLGYEVQVSESKLVVKLPLFCSVNIIESGTMVKTEVLFGFASRTSATIFNLFMFILFMFLVIFNDNDFKTPIILGAGFIGAEIWDVYRYILTESFITRLHSLIIHEFKD